MALLRTAAKCRDTPERRGGSRQWKSRQGGRAVTLTRNRSPWREGGKRNHHAPKRRNPFDSGRHTQDLSISQEEIYMFDVKAIAGGFALAAVVFVALVLLGVI
jgi:hypothetical protein